MLEDIDNGWWKGEVLLFHDEGNISPGSKTHKFAVTSGLNSSLLGYVKWFNVWRQYCFFPVNAVFDKRCLREIAEFCEQQTERRREKHKKKLTRIFSICKTFPASQMPVVEGTVAPSEEK
jgi:hypothetical protein